MHCTSKYFAASLIRRRDRLCNHEAKGQGVGHRYKSWAYFIDGPNCASKRRRKGLALSEDLSCLEVNSSAGDCARLTRRFGRTLLHQIHANRVAWLVNGSIRNYKLVSRQCEVAYPSRGVSDLTNRGASGNASAKR